MSADKPLDYSLLPDTIAGSIDDIEAKEFPSIDDLLKKTQNPNKIRRKTHGRSRTCQSEPAIPTSATNQPQTNPESPNLTPPGTPVQNEYAKMRKHRVNSHFKFLQDNLMKHVALKELTRDMPRKVIKRIPFAERAIEWCKKTWPGHPKYKFILHSPYFFLYVISLALIQAFVAAIAIADIEVIRNVRIGELVSFTFFALYILEVILRMYVKGFDFFLSIYNMAEVVLTLTAFILDFQLQGTSFVANVLSLRIIWCIHKVPGMQFVIEGIKIAAPRISIILFPLMILIYVFAVVATSTLGPQSYEYQSPDYWKDKYTYKLPNGTYIQVEGANLPYDYFGDITSSMFTLFQVMTGDGWASDIVRPTMEKKPWSWVLFISFYSLFSFVLLNIFTGIMVDAIQSYEKQQIEAKKRQSISDQSKKKILSKSKESLDTDVSSDFGKDKEEESEVCQSLNKNSLSGGKILKSVVVVNNRSESIPMTTTTTTINANESSRIHKNQFFQNQSQSPQNNSHHHNEMDSSAVNLILREIQAINDEMTNMQTRIMTRIALLENKLEQQFPQTEQFR